MTSKKVWMDINIHGHHGKTTYSKKKKIFHRLKTSAKFAKKKVCLIPLAKKLHPAR